MEGIKSSRVWCLVGVECDAGEMNISISSMGAQACQDDTHHPTQVSG
jgi:hypothetical protein